jgi:Flp pilus assembly protein TadD
MKLAVPAGANPMKSWTAALLVALLAFAGLPARADALNDARRLAGTGQFAAALAGIDKALSAKPRDAELRFARGVLLTDLGRATDAMNVFTDLSQEYPELPDPLNNLAVLHAERGELDRARGLLENALRSEPRHRTARENLGDVHLRLAIRQWQSPLSRPWLASCPWRASCSTA